MATVVLANATCFVLIAEDLLDGGALVSHDENVMAWFVDSRTDGLISAPKVVSTLGRFVPHNGRPSLSAPASSVRGLDVAAGRRERLRHELRDEGVWLPPDDGHRELVLAELDYARHPHAHEGVGPRYGAILGPRHASLGIVTPVSVLDVGDTSLDVVRRLADGRSSFVARTVGCRDRLLCFDRTQEYESSAVQVAVATDAIVIQRLDRGWVRLVTPVGVATWDGIQWENKLLSVRIAELVHPTLATADPAVLAGILEFAVHWLGAGRIGATLVWRLDGDPHDLPHLGFGAEVGIPPVSLTNRAHYPAVLSALAQYDRAALVDDVGGVRTLGVHLRTSERSRNEIAPFGGTRHSSALRFSADAPNAALVVVSSHGSLSVFWHGQRLDTD
jgi:hypothetical protein